MSTNSPEIPEGATAAQYVVKRWGGPTRLVPPRLISVGTTATRILLNNPRRMEYLIINANAGNIFVDFSVAVSAIFSIPLLPGGGSIQVLIDEDGELTTYELWGLSPSGAQFVSVYEVERV